MKDSLLCVHVITKTLNVEISRCHFADHVKELYLSAWHTCSMTIFLHSTNQIIVFWRRSCRCRRPCLSCLLILFFFFPFWKLASVIDVKTNVTQWQDGNSAFNNIDLLNKIKMQTNYCRTSINFKQSPSGESQLNAQ